MQPSVGEPASTLRRVLREAVDAPTGTTEMGLARRRRILLAGLMAAGVLTVAALTVTGSRVAIPRLEDHLVADVQRSIAADAPDVRVSATGRTIVLVGSVPSASVRTRVVARAKSRWGVERVKSDGVTLRSP